MRPLLAALLVAGCASGRDSLVVVTVDSTLPIDGIAKLRVEATAGGKTVPFNLTPVGNAATVGIPPVQSFGIEVPRRISGRIDVVVRALDGGGEVLASGSQGGEIAVGSRTDLTINLSPGDVPDLGRDAGIPDLSQLQDGGGGSDAGPADDLSVVPDLLGPVCPVVMLIVDESASTTANIDGGTNKLKAQIDAIKAAFFPLNDRVPVGLAFVGGNENNECAQGSCVLLPPATGQADMLSNAMAALMPTAGSNNGSGVFYARLQLQAFGPSRAPMIVFLQDGPGNCSSNGDGGIINEPTYSLGQINAAQGTGIATFVVFVGTNGNPSEDSTFDSQAAAGGVPCTGVACGGHQFYPGKTAPDLDFFLQQIATQIAGNCTR